MSQHDPDEQTPSWPAWLMVVVILVMLSWAGSGWLLYSRQDRGTFGDMFGAVNALFSGLAFVGIIYTVWLQRKELQLQRRELEETREELKGQKLQLAAQNETLRKQNFEDTFFQLLRLHNDILNTIDLTGNRGDTTRGRDCFAVFWQRFRGAIQNQDRSANLPDPNRINEAYLAFFEANQKEIGHYFRTLYNIVKFVNRSDVPDKRFYTNLVRAQLSSYELLLLFYNCLSDLGLEKFKPLVEQLWIAKELASKIAHQAGPQGALQ